MGGDRKALTQLGLHLGPQESTGFPWPALNKGVCVGDRIPGATGGSTEAEGRETCGWEKGQDVEGEGLPSSSPGPSLDTVLIHCWGLTRRAQGSQSPVPTSVPSPAAGAGSAPETRAAEGTRVPWRAPAPISQALTVRAVPALPPHSRLSLGSNITGGACRHTPAHRSQGRAQFWPGGSRQVGSPVPRDPVAVGCTQVAPSVPGRHPGCLATAGPAGGSHPCSPSAALPTPTLCHEPRCAKPSPF